MDIFEQIESKILIVCPNDIKYKILEEIDKKNKLINVKFITLDELKKKIYFDYDKDAIIYLIKKYKIKYNVALSYIKSMYFVSDNDYGSKKLRKLIDMKNDLINNNLLIFDNLFINLLKEYNILFYGYDYYKREDRKIIDYLKEISEVNVIELSKYDIKKLDIYEFNYIDDEVNYVLFKVIELINNGVSLNDIKFCGIDDNYVKSIKKIFGFYNINVDLDKGNSIYSTKIGKDVIKSLKDNLSFNEIIDNIRDNDSVIVNKIISILNNYIKYDGDTSDIIDLIIKDMKNSYFNKVNYASCIKVCNLENTLFNDDDFVFIFGFNNGSFPRIVKDDNYITDNLKSKLDMSLSSEENVMIRESLINKLFSIKNLFVSYKLNTYFDSYYPSILIEDYGFNVNRDSSISKIRYSKKYDEIYLTSLLDKYIKYGIKDNNLELFYNYIKVPYLKYDNSYKKINKDNLIDYLDKKLVLSYSSINDFYHCKFKYLLKHILKIDKYEDNFAAIVGNIFHNVLSRIDNSDFDIDKYYDLSIRDYELTKKDIFYLNKLKSELEYVIDSINNHKKLSGFNEALYENKFVVDKSRDDFNIIFKGFIDKILFNSKHNLLSIIDYKTGASNIDLRLVPFGINMQLTSYMYLVKNSDKFKNSHICGIYLQRILNNIPSSSDDFYSDKMDSLKLNGYSICDKERLEIFDSSYENSEMIKGMKIKKDGDFSSYSKVLDEAQIDKLIDITDKNIDNAVNDILNGEFSIDPKRIDGVNLGCEFCSYKDICYRKEKDINDIEGYKDLSFLKENN